MQVIPLQPVESQAFSIVLNGQNCDIRVYQLSTGLYFDLTSNGIVICTTRLCVNCVPIVRNPVSGFIGDFTFIDIIATDNPDYLGLGTGFILVYQ
jgi:hypothetical protein